MIFGAHMSAAGGVHQVFARGEAVGCQTLQLFTKNERQWRAKPLAEEHIALFHAEARRSGIAPLLSHASYLINLAAPKDELWEQSLAAFADELERCSLLGVPYLVVHPGAHTGSGAEAGIARVAAGLNRLFADGAGGTVTVLLETTAGQGTCLGGTFEELACLLSLVDDTARVAICVDTCHVFAAGYDFREPDVYQHMIARLDDLVGLERVKAFHLNDSKGVAGSHLDRHEAIGDGQIGLDGFRHLVNDPRLAGMPMILETPKGKDDAEDIRNLATLRGLQSLSIVREDCAEEAPSKI
jgi:deoxyribonuclease IV